MATQFSISDGRKWKVPFFSIFTGQAFSLLGSELVSFSLIWYLTVQTGSATVLATVSIFSMLPRVALGAFIGPLIDRWNRKYIMLASDSLVAISTVVIAVLFTSGNVEIWQIYALILVRSIGGAFHYPSMASSTSLMVPEEHLPRIQGINQMLNGGLGIISAPLGALLYELVPLQSILAIDVITALFAIFPLILIAIPQPEKKIMNGTNNSEKPSYWGELKEGVKYMASWPGMMIVIGMAMLINFVLTPASALLPLLVKDHFLGTVQQLGFLESIFGAGVIIGGLGLGIWGGFKNKSITLMVFLMIMGFGFGSLGMLTAAQFNIALIGAAITAISLPFMNGSIGAIMQVSVAPEMQGRVMSLLGSASGILGPIGLLLAGPISDKFGIRIWFVIAGVVCIGLAFVGFFIPQVMNLEVDGKKLRKLDDSILELA
jgi:MFS transporter, DHA3 family, macrolide efflux protein